MKLEDEKIVRLVLTGLLLIFGRTPEQTAEGFRPYTPQKACDAVDVLAKRYLEEDEL